MDDRDIIRELFRTISGMKRLPWESMLTEDISGCEFVCVETIRHFQQTHPDVPGIYVTELASNLHVTKSSVSKLLGRLEQKDLIRRTVDRNDRRNTFVSLTEKGEKTCTAQHARGQLVMRRVVARRGESHYRMILAGMRELTQVMASEMAAIGQPNENIKQTKEGTQCDSF